jgi:hypothetical protein
MKSPQVINTNEDKVMSFDGSSVINNNTQLELGSYEGIPTIEVNIFLWNLMGDIQIGPISLTMTYEYTLDIWRINISDLNVDPTTLVDRNKYVGKVSCTDSSNMRTFKINEFCIDNDSFEDTWMRLPYQVEIVNHQIRWYDDVANFGNLANCKFVADVYEGGVGTTYATSTSRVTHRGPIIPYSV